MNTNWVQPDSYSFKALLWCILLVLLPAAPVSAVGGGDLSAGSDLVLTLGKERVYPGESVPVTIILTIQGSTVRNIRFPEFASSLLEVSEIRQLDQQAGEQTEGMTRYRFGGLLKPIRPGRFTIGPATLSCEVKESAKGSSAFFGGQESRLLKLVSAPATLEVLPLPSKGKPALFSGAIGSFTLSVKTFPSQVSIGEPITVTTKISGTGSLADAACPALVDTAMQSFPVHALRSAAELTCEQVLIPKKAIRLPPVTWNFFNPEMGEYHLLRGNVESQVLVYAVPVVTTAKHVHSAEDGKMPAPILRYSLVAIAAMIMIALMIIRLKNQRRSAPIKNFVTSSIDLKKMLQSAENASINGDVEMFYNIVHEVIQASVGISYNLSPDESGAFQPNIYSPQCDEKHDDRFEIMAITTACDKVRYGRIMPDCNAMAADLESLKQLLSSRPQ